MSMKELKIAYFMFWDASRLSNAVGGAFFTNNLNYLKPR